MTLKIEFILSPLHGAKNSNQLNFMKHVAGRKFFLPQQKTGISHEESFCYHTSPLHLHWCVPTLTHTHVPTTSSFSLFILSGERLLCLRTLTLTASLTRDEIYRDLNSRQMHETPSALLSKAQVEQGRIIYDYMRQGARTIWACLCTFHLQFSVSLILLILLNSHRV